MNEILFNNWQSVFRVIIMAFSAYMLLIFMLRLSGKRTLSQMNAFDFVVTVALGSCLSSVILTKNVTLSEGITAMGMLVFLQYLLTWLCIRVPIVERLIKSHPNTLVKKGILLEQQMKKERITKDEIYSALRQSHSENMDNVVSITLETNGKLSVTYKLGERIDLT